jgi:hypothetical protein
MLAVVAAAQGARVLEHLRVVLAAQAAAVLVQMQPVVLYLPLEVMEQQIAAAAVAVEQTLFQALAQVLNQRAAMVVLELLFLVMRQLLQ